VKDLLRDAARSIKIVKMAPRAVKRPGMSVDDAYVNLTGNCAGGRACGGLLSDGGARLACGLPIRLTTGSSTRSRSC